MDSPDGFPTVSTNGTHVFITFGTDRGAVTRILSAKAAARLAGELAAKLAAFGASYEPPSAPTLSRVPPLADRPDPFASWSITT